MKLAFVDIGTEFKLGGETGIRETYGSIGDVISAILPNIYVLAGVVLFILLLAGGIGLIVSAGSNNPEGAAKGKKAVTAAIIGFIIIFGSYWIIQIVEVITGVDILGGGGL